MPVRFTKSEKIYTNRALYFSFRAISLSECPKHTTAFTQKETSPPVFQVPHSSSSKISLSYTPSIAKDPLQTQRRRWSTGELMELISALATLKTTDIAKTIGVNPKALRSVLRRNGVSLRAIREHAKKERFNEAAGLVVRRPVAGPSAIYGAAALAALPDDACRWPSGDPAEPGFAFCGARASGRSSYCAHHKARAFDRGTIDDRK